MSYFQSKPQIGGLLGNFGLPDYTAGVQAALDENAAKAKPKKDMWWLGAIGDAMQAFNGQEGTYAAAMAQKQQAEMQEHQRQLQRMEGREDKLWEAENTPRKPSLFEMGNSLVSYDPESGPSVVYQGESPAEQYAKMLGAQPGTPEYVNAIKDYVLKSNGPTGIAADQEMLDRRFSNSQALKGTPTYQQTHPSPKAGGKPQYEYRMGPGGRLQKRRVN